MGLTVAVTGPTGDIGRAFVGALERAREVDRIVGFARRPFDPRTAGWRKVEYRCGDVLDRAAVEALVEGADVVAHLAFVILGDDERSAAVNVEGSRIVFEAAAAAGVRRLVYTSSVAAYGFHADSPGRLTEDEQPRGTERHSYSRQKAEVERLLAQTLAGSGTDPYVFRPCIVAGPDALMLIEAVPYIRIGRRMPPTARRLLELMPVLKPVIPDNGVPFQLVHHDDVARALRAAALGRGSPGVYNLAGSGTVTLSDLAEELGWYAVPVPERAADVAAEAVARLPFLPAEAQWIEAARAPVLMDTRHARTELGWRPRHGSRAVLRETVTAARADGLLG